VEKVGKTLEEELHAEVKTLRTELAEIKALLLAQGSGAR